MPQLQLQQHWIWATSTTYTAGCNTESLTHCARPEIQLASSCKLGRVNTLSHNGNSRGFVLFYFVFVCLFVCLFLSKINSHEAAKPAGFRRAPLRGALSLILCTMFKPQLSLNFWFGAFPLMWSSRVWLLLLSSFMKLGDVLLFP